ncbi:MAG: Gfo/Idh/MocA family protein [Marinosulfonomonas sp.]
MEKLGVGIIGCGNISTSYLRLAPTFAALDVRAVADVNMDAAHARAAEFGVRAETVDDLLAAEDLDVIVNLTIPEAHFPITKRILESGKHAYSEKPFVLTLEQGEELRRICEETGLRVGSAPDTFFGGAHQLARAALDDGLIGDVVAGSCHVMNRGMESWHPNPDFFFVEGGGPMLDLGPYYVTNLIQLLGPVKRVAALTSSAFETRTIGSGPREGETVPVETPTNIHALLEFENGATITMSSSWDVWTHNHPNTELYGKDGSLFVPDPNFFSGDVKYAVGGEEIKDVPGWDHPFGIINQDNSSGGVANYRTAGLAEMAQAIVEDRPHRCSLDLALHAVDVMTSIMKSGETGTFVDLTTRCDRPAPLGPDLARALMA